MKKIEKLTKDQEQNLEKFIQECLAWGRCCDPADRKTAEDAITNLYKAVGKNSPYFWWLPGPAAGSIVRAIILDKNIGNNPWDNIGGNVRENIKDDLISDLWDNLGDNLGDNLRNNLWDNISWHFWGQHEIYWPAFYYWPDVAVKRMHTEDQRTKLSWWMSIAKSCGWWEPYERVCFVCDRPQAQAADEQGRLHKEDGPALLCRDGFGMWAWHGTIVPREIIEEPEKITVASIEQENNIEIRRIRTERYGLSRYLIDSGAKLIHKDDWGKLYHKEVAGDEPIVMVKVVNSTPEADGSMKDYFLRVPPDIKTARQAVAWTFGEDANTYSPAVET